MELDGNSTVFLKPKKNLSGGTEWNNGNQITQKEEYMKIISKTAREEQDQPDEKEEVDRIRLDEKIKKYLTIAKEIVSKIEKTEEFLHISAN